MAKGFFEGILIPTSTFLLRQNMFHYFLRSPCCLCSIRRQKSTEVTDTEPDKRLWPIEIPKRIKRDSTAILRALASTVERDPLAPEYTFIDDPLTIPASHDQKRIFALSRAAGQRAARFMVNEVPEAFAHDDAAPHIKTCSETTLLDFLRDGSYDFFDQAYDPDVTEYQHTQATEEALLERIQLRRVAHAMEVYNAMKRLEVKASPTTLQSLLELLCMYNHKDPMDLYPTERQYLVPKHLNRVSQWQGGCLAEQIFEALPEKTAKAYNALIRGMTKYKNAQGGLKLYEEMKVKQIPVYKRTYIEMLEKADKATGVQKGKLHESVDKGQKYWDHVLALLRGIKDSGVGPCHEMFTAVLRSLDNARVEKKLEKMDAVLNEMHILGFEPSLEDWHFVLNISFVALPMNQKLKCMTVVLAELKKNPRKIEKLEDAIFFLTAMLKIVEHLNNTELAKELHELRESYGFSVKLRAQDDFLYYKNFFTQISQTETADYVMEEYTKGVPHVYIPSREVFYSIIDCVKLHSGLHYLPQLLQDILLMVNKELNIVTAHLFGVLADQKSSKLQSEFVKMADVMYTYWIDSVEWAEAISQTNRPWGIQRDVMNGELLGYLIEIAFNSGDLDMAWKFFMGYRERIEDFRDRPQDRAYTALFNAFFASGDPEKIMTIVTTMSDQNVPVVYRLIDDAKDDLDNMLDESQRAELDRL